ncbi:MAG: ABC transporter ATP-binding protein [Planctomycetaceae bacterium]|nr:MAG: ABC transporter ATP-binding protein [Planctomycetaceae bacterium]
MVEEQPKSNDDGQAEAVVRVRGLEKWYGKEHAVGGVDLDVPRGQILGLVGPDGAGKSSLLRCVAGVLQHDGGHIHVMGSTIDSDRSAESIKSRLGWMPQGLGNNLYRELSVEENVDYFANLRSLPPDELKQRKRRLLEVTRLTPFTNRTVKQLSGGMKQKLALICILIHYPELLVLDEPTTGVDPLSRRDFWSILTQLVAERSMTTLVSTAYMDEASYFARLALMVDGTILRQGSREDVLSEVHETKVGIRTGEQMAALNRLKKQFRHVQIMGSELHVLVRGDDPADARRQVEETLEGMDVQEVRTLHADLEDALVTLICRRPEHETTNEDQEHDRPSSPPNDRWAVRLVRAVFPRRRTEPEPATELAELIGEQVPPERRVDEDGAVEASGLIRQFGDFRAVDDVSFSIAPGQIFGLLGPNGAGKTTVIKMLTGLLPPTGGSGRVAGADIHGVPLHVKQRIGYMAQTFSLYPDLSVLENVALYATVYRVPRRELRQRCRWVLQLAGLTGMAHKRTNAVPMGARQRMALGCALVHRPQVVFLDEPTSGVDPVGRRQFWEILVRLARQWRVAILVTTHYMSEAEHCDHLGLMHDGALIALGTPEQLRKDVASEAGTPLLVETDDPLAALDVLRRAGFDDVVLQGRSVRLLSRDHRHDEKQIRQPLDEAGIRVTEMSQGDVTVQDVFVHHVTASNRGAATDDPM